MLPSASTPIQLDDEQETQAVADGGVEAHRSDKDEPDEDDGDKVDQADKNRPSDTADTAEPRTTPAQTANEKSPGPTQGGASAATKELAASGARKLPGESSHAGLTPKAQGILGSAQAAGLKLISGLRAGEKLGHGNGSAVDVSNVPGNSRSGSPEMRAFAESVRAAGKAGDPDVGYVIYQQKIASARDGWAWRPMEDRGSNTANHFDHVHVSTDPNR